MQLCASYVFYDFFLRCSSFCIILLACVAAAFSFSTLAPMLFSPDEGREGKESFLFSFPPPPHLLVRLNQQSGSTLFHSGGVIFVVTSVLPIPEGTENSEYIFFCAYRARTPLVVRKFRDNTAWQASRNDNKITQGLQVHRTVLTRSK